MTTNSMYMESHLHMLLTENASKSVPHQDYHIVLICTQSEKYV